MQEKSLDLATELPHPSERLQLGLPAVFAGCPFSIRTISPTIYGPTQIPITEHLSGRVAQRHLTVLALLTMPTKRLRLDLLTTRRANVIIM